MRVTRFCSLAEYEYFISGHVLTNKTDHYRGGKGGSSSVGFCFSTDEPRTAWRYLKGIVSYDVCMVLDFNEEALTPSIGKYVDYSDDIGIQTCLKREYCTRRYSNKSAKLVQVLKPEEFATDDELVALQLIGKFKNQFK